MLHYDYYYTIGVTHQVCEDYATQGEVPTPFMVLSDGCSASENTDVGARILTLATKHIIENATQWPLDYLSFGKLLISNALKIVDQMQHAHSVLDATVMLAFLQEDNIMVYVYGDGCLLFKDHEDNIGTIEIVFTHNAPFYLTYWCNQKRLFEYAKCEENPLLLIDSVNGQSEPKSFKTQLTFCFPLDKFKMVAIASDGAAQCFDIHQKTKVPLYNIATDFLAFQNLNDKFVKHHTENTLKHYAKQGIYPADDLSIGVFVQ